MTAAIVPIRPEWQTASPTAQAKADALLAGGRVTLFLVEPGRVHAEVRGVSGPHLVALRAGHWYCDCPARGQCSHLVAVWRVTVPGTPDARR
jgi:uncharacterized Zn finger protein